MYTTDHSMVKLIGRSVCVHLSWASPLRFITVWATTLGLRYSLVSTLFACKTYSQYLGNLDFAAFIRKSLILIVWSLYWSNFSLKINGWSHIVKVIPAGYHCLISRFPTQQSWTLYLYSLYRSHDLNIQCGQFWFLPNPPFPLFLDISIGFLNNGAQKFKFPGFCIHHSDWLNVINFRDQTKD